MSVFVVVNSVESDRLKYEYVSVHTFSEKMSLSRHELSAFVRMYMLIGMRVCSCMLACSFICPHLYAVSVIDACLGICT